MTRRWDKQRLWLEEARGRGGRRGGAKEQERARPRAGKCKFVSQSLITKFPWALEGVAAGCPWFSVG